MSIPLEIKYVPGTVVVGEHGRVVTRGYTQIGEMKIYGNQVVIGPHGEREISPGWTEWQDGRIDLAPH